jgi:HAE1 family hydrophobic/amphiphilic exporter-1
MIMIAALLIGIVALVSLPLDLYPPMDVPVALVSTTYSGGTSTEVEQQVTKPIEQALQSLSGVEEIDSTSIQNVSQVVVQFDYGVDMSQELEDMRSDVNTVANQLPSTANVPIVRQYDPSQKPIMTIALSGGSSVAAISELADNVITPALEHVNGVANVNEIGNLTRQITINVDPHKLQYYGLSVPQVAADIAAANFSADVGQAIRGNQLIPLKVDGEFTSPQELLQVPIVLASKQTISLGDLATVQDGYQDVTLVAAQDDHPAVAFTIQQASGGNTVAVSNAVNATLAQLRKNLPAGTKLTVISDDAQTIKQAVKLVAEHTLLGFLIGIGLMLLILRSVRTTVVIAVAIPISVMTAFILMYLNNLTVNAITLGSLGIALGSLVDFSVVVLESIFRARQRGLNAKEAAGVGTQEVGMAVLAAAMAQICVFAPSLFTSGIAGQLFKPMALTVTFSHIVALIVALTLTPMLASKLLKGSRFAAEETIPGLTAPFRVWAPFDWFGRGMHDLTEGYRKILKWSLRHRHFVVILALVMFVAVLPLSRKLGNELMPVTTNNQINVSLTLAPGTSLERTTEVTKEVENRIRQHLPNIVSVFTEIGRSSDNSPSGAVAGSAQASSNTSQLIVTLKLGPKDSTNLIANQMQRYLNDIPGAQIVAAASIVGSGLNGNQIKVRITGPDLNTLALLSDQVTKVMEKAPYLRYVDNQMSAGEPIYEIKLNQNALIQYSLTEQQVVSALRSAYQGSSSGTYYQGENDINILVHFPENYSEDITKLSEMSVTNALGQSIPLIQVAKVILANEPTIVSHLTGVRTVTVQANVFGMSNGQAQAALTQSFKSLRIPSGYTIDYGIYSRFQSQAFRSLALALLASVILVYMVMAGMFESLLTPFVIMFSLPPTFVGAILGLYLTHNTINMNSLMGMIMLIGLVTNNAIVLVDYTNQRRAAGLSLTEALLEAGPVRLRPILLTTVTNVAAMLPLLILGGEGTESLVSMAAVVTFGLSMSTLITLLLVPVMYVNLEKLIKT